MNVIWKSSGSCIEKEILTKGKFSKKPTERSTCRIKIDDVNYEGLSTGDMRAGEDLHSEYLKTLSEDSTAKIGDANSELDEYIERIIQTMFIGEVSYVRISISYCDEITCGNKGSIDFKITLISCDLNKPIWQWTVREKYNVALSYKEVGVTLYKSMRIVQAFHKFSRACKVLITLEPMEDQEIEGTLRKDIENLRKVLYNNMAECHLIRKNYDHAISLCDKVLARDENNVKALYRKAVAHENLKDYESATVYMEKVVELESRNVSAKERLVLYRKKLHQAQKNYDNIVKKMFA